MKRLTTTALLLGLAVCLFTPSVDAATTNLNVGQYIEDPISQVFFKNAQGQVIDAPQVAFPMRTASFQCKTSANGGPSAQLGDQYQKLFVSVPDRVVGGWEVNVSPTNGAAAGWSNPSNPGILSIDDDTNGGCNRRSGESGYGGLFSIKTNEAQTDGACSVGCTDASNSPKVGSSQTFATAQQIALLSSDMPHVGWEGTLENYKLEQTLPAGLPAGSYNLPLTITLLEL